MKFKKIFFLFLLFLPTTKSFAQCDTTTLLEYHIQAHTTDNNIPLEIGSHYIWFNPACTPKHVLLLYLVGTYDIPANTNYFPILAADNGFNVISLRYPNDTSAQQSCRLSSDTNCYENFRREILEGINYSPDITVDSFNCVYNRLLKLLQYLNTIHPTQGWNDFYSGNSINWSAIVVSGHSQGGGHAAMIAKDHLVKGVLTFSSPNDYSVFFNDAARWTYLPHITPDSCYFAFGNLHDDIVNFSEQYLQWNALNLDAFGDTILVTTHSCPYMNSHLLYTTDTNSALSGNHDLTIRDAETPLDTAGVPVYLPVWKYMLRLPCAPMGIDAAEKEKTVLTLYPNPAQDEVVIAFENKNQESANLFLYNAMGELVMEVENISVDKITLSLNEFSPGIYFVKVINSRGVEKSERLIINN